VAVFYRHPIAGWTIPGFKFDEIYAADKYYAPLGIEGGIARSLQNMQKLADLLAEHNIPLIVAVYPWPLQLAMNDRDSRQIVMYRDFCKNNCQEFIDAFPAFFAFKDTHPDWYERLFIEGDVHWTEEGNKLIYEELAKHLL
jgi:acetyltransferase AlgX (SGNH hydrolase-like protein)